MIRAALSACVFAWAAAATVTGASAQTGGTYVLKIGDTIQVIVLEDPELTRTVLIRPDGRISLPIAGTLTAEGRTPEQLRNIIRSRLAGNFIEPPSVTVSVSSVALEEAEVEEPEERGEFFVLGEVARPGRYTFEMDEAITILEALSVAGGPGPFAARARIQIREVVEDVETVRLFNYDAVEDGFAVTASDLAALADGAVIVVPERGLFE
ncbi:MAG: polysaccharide biosynthesis/export family protein [Pseudomonadota bacterium]